VPGPAKPKKVNVVPSASAEPAAADDFPPATRASPTVPQPPLRNPNLSDFDALMAQMEAELARNRPSTARVPSATTPQAAAAQAAPRPANPVDSMDLDSSDGEEDGDEEMGAMDDELASLFRSVAGGEAERGEGGAMDLNLVKNFLESFQSQGGFGGPAGNLAGRMGFQLPRDTAREE